MMSSMTRMSLPSETMQGRIVVRDIQVLDIQFIPPTSRCTRAASMESGRWVELALEC